MITQNNLLDVIALLDYKEIQKAMEDYGDYIGLYLHIHNTGCTVEIESLLYYDNSLPDNGNLCADKNDFAQIVNEAEIFPPHYSLS